MRKYHHDKTGQPDLPSQKEIGAILENEADRPIPAGKETVHYPDFETIVNVLNFYGQSAKLFESATGTIEEIVSDGMKVVSQLAQAIIDDHAADAIKRLNDAYDYLAEEDEPQKSDLIFVFGAKTTHRIEKAIELYKAGYAPKILMTGGSPIYASGHEAVEAETFAALAQQAGIASAVMIIEDKAITIADNVRRSLNLLDEKSFKFESLICVLSPYAQRRGYTTLQKYLSDRVKIYRVNSKTLPIYQRDQWFKNEVAIKVILNEFVKMRASVAYNSS